MRYLLDAVIQAYQHDAEQHQAFGWQVERKAAGMNGLIYRVQSDNPRQQPMAVKISQRDERRRTEREYSVMNACFTMGLGELVPLPLIFYDQPQGLPGDVLIMEWVTGKVLQVPPPPEDTTTWQAILETFAQVHTLRPSRRIKLYPAVMAITHPADLYSIVQTRREQLPASGTLGVFTADELDTLLAAVAKRFPAQWDEAPPTRLILCDANPTNMILQDGIIRLIDWANSGWSDPAFDIADMLAQPSYQALPEAHRMWIRATYAELVEESHA
ncbi:MAG: aminoglycoside phosphotransferase family protein, partial [Acidobacteriales bacterium]|nr:aminoglycoside phosphotransferase family protein [Terriglobales bacterium]